MVRYDLCLPWYWEYDADFVGMIERACTVRGLRLWTITPASVFESVTGLYTGQLDFGTLLDRATDDPRFEPIRRYARDNHRHRINPREISEWAEDKATMHLELIQAGLQTPYTILLAPYVQQPVLPPLDLAPLGATFVLKPALGGGGEGVRLNVASLEDLLRARLDFPRQKYLAQATVTPRLLSGRQAWFRVFYVGGECLPCWWHPQTHVFAKLTVAEETEYGLATLSAATRCIASVCRLDWFSTEIALTEDGRFVVVDYVNDGIDTRLQSRAADGVPDEILQRMAEGLVDLVFRNRSS